MEDKEKVNQTEQNNLSSNNESDINQEEKTNQENLELNQTEEINKEISEQVPSDETTEKKGDEEVNEMEKLQNEINQLRDEVNQWKDKFLRKMAEFDNYKKRVEQDQIQLIKYANEKLIKDLLPIIDDFERTLTFSKEELKNNTILQGVEMVYNKLMKVLSDYGLKKIDALNQPFDFNYHEALLQVPKENVEPMTVVEEVEKGYLLHDKVIRHSKVIVSSEMNIESASSENQNNNNEEVK
ncbi:MAG: nucleotide exchange factor GrpE [Ignavibacteria bacterium]|nr:nucleotide exchange factor GrpE [Ignavibacteria bacterium]